MNILEALSRPFAIQPEILLSMLTIYQQRVAAGRTNPPSSIVEPRAKTKPDGIAEIHVQGLLQKRPSSLTQLFGGTDMQTLQQELDAALKDPAVKGIALVIDSPGGDVDGIQTFADQVVAARQKKPVQAVIENGLSAAYWIASAASKVYVAEGTTLVGSIGIVATHFDSSNAEAQRGIKITEIAAGKYKSVTSQHAPLSDLGRQKMQDIADSLYSVFVNSVARNRQRSTDAVLQGMADGRIFVGEQAVKAGLVDGVKTLHQVKANLLQPNHAPAQAARAAAKTTSKFSAVGAKTRNDKQPEQSLVSRAEHLIVEAAKKGKNLTPLEAVNAVLGERGKPPVADRSQPNTATRIEQPAARSTESGKSDNEIMAQARALAHRARELMHTDRALQLVEAVAKANKEMFANTQI